jgi:hypothetical protein
MALGEGEGEAARDCEGTESGREGARAWGRAPAGRREGEAFAMGGQGCGANSNGRSRFVRGWTRGQAT